MKKIVLLIFICLSFVLVGCSSDKKEVKEVKKEEKTDALKFKEDYESLNGKELEYGDKKFKIREVDIKEDNPFIYSDAEKVIEMMENKESFIVYFGFNTCPWCRSVVGILSDVANDLGLEKIYYVDVKDIRDVMELDEDNKPKTKTKGSDSYYKLLEKFDNVLEDYTLTDKDDKEIKTGTKRIYAPNVVAVVNGKAKKLTTGISDKQTESNMELTDEIKEDSYKKFEKVLKLVSEKSASCSLNGDSKC